VRAISLWTSRWIVPGLASALLVAAGAAQAAAPAAAAASAPAGSASTAPAARLTEPLARAAVAQRVAGRGALLGLAQAGQRVVAVGERGSVLLSDDAGRTWRQAPQVPVSVTLTAVQFVDERTGWAVGHQGVVLRSDDGGEHWSRQLDGAAAARLALAEVQALPAPAPKALADARRSVQEGADKPLLALHFRNAREGLVIGAFGLMLATQDGGRTWQSVASRLDNPKGVHLYALHREGDSLLVAGEQGGVWHSGDGGGRFERIATPYQGSWFTVVHERGAWLVAGLRGNVLRSADAGRSWTALASPAPVSVTSVLRDDPGQGGGLWLANQAGHLMTPRMTPGTGEARLHMAAATAAQQPGALLRQGDGSLLIAGWNGITRIDASALKSALKTTP
jgi:photosystem II stability/assembly factor-like uncharacterized protein